MQGILLKVFLLLLAERQLQCQPTLRQIPVFRPATSQSENSKQAAVRLVVALKASDAFSGATSQNAGTTQAQVAAITSNVAAVQFVEEVTRGIFSMQVADTSKNVADVLAQLRAQPGVAYAEIDQRNIKFRVPNDEFFGAQVQYDMFKIQAPRVWDFLTNAASSSSVCVIDSTIWYDHPDLPFIPVSQRNKFPSNLPDFAEELHGTHVSGTIGAVGNNAKGVTGVAWQSNLVTCAFISEGCSDKRTFNSTGGLDSDALKCVKWCISNGAKIFQASWGTSLSRTGPGLFVQDYIKLASAAGGIWVAAAGNNGAVLGTGFNDLKIFPLSIQSDAIVGVAASDETDRLANFSNRGSSVVHLAAPGNTIASTVPSIALDYAISNGDCSSFGTNRVQSEDYAYASGTSMAAPHVSGALALLTTVAGNRLNSQQIKRILLQTVDVNSNLQGLVMSNGRLNLWKAMQAVGFAFQHASRPGETYIVYDVQRSCKIVNDQQLAAYGYTPDTVFKQDASVALYEWTLAEPCPWPNGFYKEDGSTTTVHLYTVQVNRYQNFKIGGSLCSASGPRLAALNGASRTVFVPQGSLLGTGRFDAGSCVVGLFRRKDLPSQVVRLVFGPGDGTPKRRCDLVDGSAHLQAWSAAFGYSLQLLKPKRYTRMVRQGSTDLGKCVWPDGLYKQGGQYYKLYTAWNSAQTVHAAAGDRFCTFSISSEQQAQVAAAGGESAFVAVPDGAGLTLGRTESPVC